MAFNSGLFYIRANPRTVDLLTRIAGGRGQGAGVGVGWERAFGGFGLRSWVGGMGARMQGQLTLPALCISIHRIGPHPTPTPPSHPTASAPAPAGSAADKLGKHKEWDQSVWNEFIFFLSHGNYKSPQVRRQGGRGGGPAAPAAAAPCCLLVSASPSPCRALRRKAALLP